MNAEPGIEGFLDQYPEWRACPDLILDPPTAEELSVEWGDVDSHLLSRCRELLTSYATRGAHYWMMRMQGSNDKFAAMVALQTGPALSTDDTFFQGQKPLYEQFGSQKHLDRYLQAAKRRGFTPSPNSTYFPGLARFQGDPEAFVTRAQGRSYIRKLCERRGWACEGGVNVAHREPESDPHEGGKPLADDIVRTTAAQMIKRDPSVARMDRRDLRQKIIDKHGPSQA